MKQRQSGSSLVFVLLTLAVISVVLLAGSAALLSAARQRSALENGKVADQMRQSALQEAFARIKQSVTVYGVAGSGTNLTPRIRGYSDANCQTLIPDGVIAITAQLPSGNSDCPHYELAMRNTVTTSKYVFEVQDLQSSAVLTITGNATLNFTAISTGLTSATITCLPVACSGSSLPPFVTATNPTQVTLSNMVFAATAKPSDPALQVNNVLSGVPFTITKGFTTIEATGAAADGTESRSLTIVRPSGTVTSLTTERFNAAGLCFPDTDPGTQCR